MITNKYPTVICKECGTSQQAAYYEPTKSEMVKNRLCFNCWFWTEKIKIKDDPRVARIEGSHYQIGDALPPGTPKHCAGFGGSSFTIKFNDGRTVQTSNLWHQGTIPTHFVDRLPDNAIFVYTDHVGSTYAPK